MQADRIQACLQVLRRVVNFFVGGVPGNKHVHVDICVVVKAKVTLDAIWIGVLIKAMANPALPLRYLLFFVLFLMFNGLLLILFTVLSPVSFWHFELEG